MSSRMPPFRAGSIDEAARPPGPSAPGPSAPGPSAGRAPADRPTDFVLGGPPARGSALAHGPLPRTLWLLATLLAAAALVVARLPSELSTRLVEHHVAEAAAVAVTTLFAAAVAHRIGGRPFVSLLVALVLGVAAVGTARPEVTAGVAAATAVLAGLAAVLLTVPARGPVAVVREVVVALLVSAVGSLAVSAYGAGVETGRFRYLALGAALVFSLVVASRLGVGLHGLSPRGTLVLGLGILAVLVAVVYGEALTRWGSADLVAMLARTRAELRAHLGAVPHPIQLVIGWPALVYGVWLRSRRSHAWWVCVFGVAATVPTACALLDPMVSVERAALGALYSVVPGLLLGAVAIAVDRAVTGPPRSGRGRRAGGRAAAAIRPEPGRTRSLI